MKAWFKSSSESVHASSDLTPKPWCCESQVEMKDASDGDTTFVLRSIFTDESDTLIFTYKQTGEVILENSAYSTEDNEVKKMVRHVYACLQCACISTIRNQKKLFEKHYVL